MQTPAEKHSASAPPPRRLRYFWLGLAGICIALGTIGIFLPGLPTTPFILVAAWAAPKGSPRLAHWLENHPKFGPLLYAWRTERAVPRSAKITGIILMAISWTILWWIGTSTVMLTVLSVFFLIGAGFLLSLKVSKPID